MDYEKKYKEAIERAKIWQEHLYDVNDKDYADELNYIFPELKESEDEKTKKEIINYFKCQSRDEPSRRDTHNKWIGYIEKHALSKDDYDFLRDCARVLKTFGWQSYADRLTGLCPALGEEAKVMMSTPIIFDESEDERIRKELIFYFQEEIPQCSIQEHADKMKEFISWLKRREVERTKLELKAGNSYFCYKSRWERADSETFKKGLIYKCNKDGVLDNFVIKNPEQHFIEIKNECIAWLEKQGQKSAEWSYNDDVHRDAAIRYLKGIQSPHDTAYQMKEETINWLKSLKDRVQPQPKQEWSEEDETMITDLSVIVHTYFSEISGIPFKHDLSEDKIRTWLKSLRPPYYCDSCKLKKSIEKSTLDIEIPFGAKDSELIEETISIPDGCYAIIKGNKVIIRKLQAKRLNFNKK